jgi:hypothetical protein
MLSCATVGANLVCGDPRVNQARRKPKLTIRFARQAAKTMFVNALGAPIDEAMKQQ